MKLLLGVFALGLAIVLGGALSGPMVERWQDANTYQRQVEQLQLEREQTALQDWQQQTAATAASRAAASNGFYLLGLMLGGVAVFIAYDMYRQRRVPLVRADRYGQLPVSRPQIEAGQFTDLARVIALEVARVHQLEAIHQPGQTPAQLHQHITQPAQLQGAPTAIAALPDAGAGEAPELPGPTDLVRVLDTFTPSKDAIYLGAAAGGAPLVVPIGALCHVALAGATGGGKSNLLRLILPQLQAIGARVVLADPHYAPLDPESGDDWRPIAQRLAMAPAVTPAAIDELLDYLVEELQARLERRRRNEPVGAPLFLAFDELPVIVDTVKSAPERLGKILREGRKVRLLTIGASQDFLVKTIGGSSAVRDCYRTAFYVGGDQISAAALLDLPRREIDDGPLGQGVVLLRSAATAAAQLVRAPLASNAALYRLLGASHTTSQPASPIGETGPREVAREVAREVGGGEVLPADADALGARALRVRSMLLEKRSQNEILLAIWGASGGKAYQVATEEYRAIVAQLLRGAA